MNKKERELAYLKELIFTVNTDLLYIESMQELYNELSNKKTDYQNIISLGCCPNCYIGLCTEKNKINNGTCYRCWQIALED